MREKKEGLDALLEDVQREVREAQMTLDAKTTAVDAYDRTFGGVATLLAGFLRLADKPELAAKVRPSARRPGQTAEAAGDPNPDPVAAPPEK